MRRITGSALPLAMAAALLHGGAAQAATSDPLRDLQWGLDQVRAEQAWTSTTGAGAVLLFQTPVATAATATTTAAAKTRRERQRDLAGVRSGFVVSSSAVVAG